VAGGQERELRRRIKSVQSTRKITKAMELIAASQISRAQSRIAANRPYREGMARIILEAAAGDRAAAEKLLGVPESISRVVVLVIVGDRGLSGGYNSSVLRAAERLVSKLKREGTDVTVVAVGKKALSYLRFRGIVAAHSFQGFSDKPTFADARDVAAATAAPFVQGAADQVLMVSMRFLSSATQAVETRQLLPLPEPQGAAAGAPRGIGVIPYEPAARDGGGDGERRRAGALAHPGDEPGPTGLDYDRDHGDCGWRRGAAPGKGACMTITTDTETQLETGRVVAITGPVVDVEFPPHSLPEINHAVEMDLELDGKRITVTGEVAQQIGEGRVRCVCMQPTDGLVRGAVVRQTGRGITVPVGTAVLGHVFNVGR